MANLNQRLRRLWHGGDYNPEQWPREVWTEDVEMMVDTEYHVATLGVFSWVKLEPSEGEFDFEWLDDVIARLTASNRYFILATPSAAPPAWMAKKYPEIIRTGADRVRRLHGNRVNYNFSSPIYQEKCRIIATKLAERYGNHPNLLAWHVSNEYGGADYSAESVEAFREWLKVKFNRSLEALNEAYWTAFWSHSFTDWSEIDPPGGPYGETAIQGLTVDWRRFTTDQTVAFMEIEAAPLRAITPHVPITTNMMGTYPELDYRKFASHLDFISWDSYPAFTGPMSEARTWIAAAFRHDLMRGLKRGTPWLLMEYSPGSSNWYESMALKRLGVHRFEGWQAVAHGADGVQYFQWRQSRGSQEQLHGAVVSHGSSREARVYQEVRQLGHELAEWPEIIGSVPKPEVAVIFDWESWWALEAACGPTQRPKRYPETATDYYGYFWQAGIPTDVIGMDDSLEGYKIVVVPMAYSIRPGFAERIEEFVAGGGHVVFTYLSGWTDENSLVFTEGFLGPLRNVLGITSEEIDVLPRETKVPVFYNNEQYAAHDFCELVHPTTAEILAEYAGEFYAGRAAVTQNGFGKGTATYVAFRHDERFLRDLLDPLVRRAEIVHPFPGELPDGVTVQVREGETTTYFFLLNANAHGATLSTNDGEVIHLPPYGVEIRKLDLAGAMDE
jgi:beta-galactosidase